MLARVIAREVCAVATARYAFYVSGWERRSLHFVMQAIAESLKVLGAEVQDTEVKFDRVKRVIRGRPVVVILDDVDRIPPSERERIVMGLITALNAGLLCISSQRKAFQSLAEPVRSKLSPVIIEFARYRPKDLEQILLARARRGLLTDSWSPRVLAEIARSAAGDARTGIRSLQAAAIAAEDLGENTIRRPGPLGGIRDRDDTNRERIVGELSYHERLIYDLAMKSGPIHTIALRRAYLKKCHEQGVSPVARRTFSKHLKFLRDSGLLLVDDRSLAGNGRLVRAPPRWRRSL